MSESSVSQNASVLQADEAAGFAEHDVVEDIDSEQRAG
jgi:hypothetical protein